MELFLKNIFERIILTFFGIGLLERFSGFLAVAVAGSMVQISHRSDIFFIISLIFILVMIIFDKQVMITELNLKRIVSPIGVGVWLICYSPLFEINFIWLISGIIIYLIFRELLKKKMIDSKNVIKLKHLVLYNTTSAIMASASIHVLYSGVAAFPFVYSYFGR